MNAKDDLDTIRRQVRLTEADISKRLAGFAKTVSLGTADTLHYNHGEAERLDLQRALDKQVLTLQRWQGLGNTSEASAPHIQASYTRSRDVLTEAQHEYKRLSQQWADDKQRHALLQSPANSARQTLLGGNEHVSETDYYLNERSRLDRSHQAADMALGVAFEAQHSLNDQSDRMRRGRQTLQSTIHRFPGVNNLMQRIGRRQNRDRLILSCVIAFCCFLLLIRIFRV